MASSTKLISVILAGATLTSMKLLAQNAPNGEAVLAKLVPPTYPPLARQVRISGDVELMIEIQQNGKAASTEVIRGHPLLVQAALESAKQSQFECRGCAEGGLSLRLVYSFELDSSRCVEPGLRNSNEEPSRVIQSQGHVTVTDSVRGNCPPPSPETPLKEPQNVRSIKCLYLWRCARPRMIFIE